MTPRITADDVRAILAGGLVETMARHGRRTKASAFIEAATTIQSLAQAFIEMDAELVAVREAFAPFLDVKDQFPQSGKLIIKVLDGLTPITLTVTKAQFLKARAIIKGTDHD